MKTFNIYMVGVGGQGIGLLSEVLMRAADHAGFALKAVDTHGLAQRGGMVESQLRIGQTVHTPLIPEGQADLVVALERHEALRGLRLMARENATVIYYDTVWQPLDVRLGQAEEVTADMLRKAAEERGVTLLRVHVPELDDARMQNMVVLAHIDRNRLIAGIDSEHYRLAMEDLMVGGMLERNLALFERIRGAGGKR
jgi:indolepyruvate ferredoxin oxidoreductase beta subunit